MPLFEDDFLDSLPNQTWLGLQAICEKFIEFDQGINDTLRNEYYDEYIEALALLESYFEAREWDINPDLIPRVSEKRETIDQIRNFVYNINTTVESKLAEINREKQKERFKAHLSLELVYEFTQGDVEKIQSLINELRTSISQSNEIDEKHKQRILNKLEKLQSEVHKKMSDLDKIYGIVGDIFVLTKKGGEATLPWLKCAKEILAIAWQAQLHMHGLPSTLPMDLLPPIPSDDNE